MITGLVYDDLGHFWPPGSPRVIWGALGGVWGSGDPKFVNFHMGPISALRCCVLGQNNLSHYVFDILGQNWAPGAKKGHFWPK